MLDDTSSLDNTCSFDVSSHWDGCVSDVALSGSWSADAIYSPWHQYEFSPIIGNPNLPHIGQTTEFTCAVVTQQMILHAYGIEVSEAQLVYDATSKGWLTSSGTTINDMGRLLDLYGVPNYINHSGDLPSIIDALSHGRKIIVPVNSTELWEGVTFWQRLFGTHNTGPDHAIVVAGIDYSDQANPMVIINDPGHPNGANQAVPLEHFLEAWNDSNFTYLATAEAPAGLAQDAVLGNRFNNGIYGTPDFWVGVATKIAGSAIGTIIRGVLTDHIRNVLGDHGRAHSATDFSSPWDGLTDSARDQLFQTL